MTHRSPSGIPAQRAAISDVWLPRYTRAATKAVRAVAEDAVDLAAAGDDMEVAAIRWADDLYDALFPMTLAMSVAGYELSQQEMRGASRAKAFGDDVDPALLDARMMPKVDEWMTETSRAMSDTQRVKAIEVVEQGRRENWTVDELRRNLTTKVVGETAIHANTVARSATIWSYNEGAKAQYGDAGATSTEWFTTQDDVTCEFCMALDGNRAPLDGAYAAAGSTVEGTEGGVYAVGFDTEHPPIHPNCRCAILPVFAGE